MAEPAKPEPTVGRSPISGRPALIVSCLAAALAWSYWPVFADMADKWASDPQYSHSYLVPIFALFLAWRYLAVRPPLQPRTAWWGLAPLAAAVALRVAGARLYVDWLEAVSLLPALAGVVWLVAGPQALRRAALPIGFLFFMIPLPYRVESALSLPLQRWATTGSTYLLQILGRPAFAEGNVIVINEARVGVVEACNGLGMFLLFFALAAAVALLVHRPIWEKVILLVSAAPIAVGVNIVRITVTALLHEAFGSEKVDAWAHDMAGWFMMPLALVALWLLLTVLSRLFVEVASPAGPRVTRPSQHRGSRPHRTIPTPATR